MYIHMSIQYFFGSVVQTRLAISEKVISKHGDVVLAGKFVQMVVASANRLPNAMSGPDK